MPKKSRKSYAYRKAGRRSRTRVKSQYIKQRKSIKPSRVFKKKVQMLMPHKQVYGTAPGFAMQQLLPAVFPNVGFIVVMDSVLNIAQGSQMQQRAGNRVNFLFNKYAASIYSSLNTVQTIPNVPAMLQALYYFEFWSVKGQFVNVLANIDAFFNPGGVASAINTLSILTAPWAIDPQQTGFFVKKMKTFRFPEANAGGLIMKEGSYSHKYKWGGARGHMNYENNLALVPENERPIFAWVNLYPNAVTVNVTGKIVFTESNH